MGNKNLDKTYKQGIAMSCTLSNQKKKYLRSKVKQSFRKYYQHHCYFLSGIKIKGKHCLCIAEAISNYEKEYQLQNIQPKETISIKLDLSCNKVEEVGCYVLATFQDNISLGLFWNNLQELILERNNINAKGCKYLSMLPLHNLKLINLSLNPLQSKGCHYLSKVLWPRITKIDISQSCLRSQGCRFLSKCQLPILKQIDIRGFTYAEVSKFIAKYPQKNRMYLYVEASIVVFEQNETRYEWFELGDFAQQYLMKFCLMGLK